MADTVKQILAKPIQLADQVTKAADEANELIANVAYIGTPGKGILAADESTGTIGKRLSSIGVENTETNRRALCELLFTTPGALQYLNRVILFEETFYQKTAAGKPFVDVLKEGGVLPGIKVDNYSVGTNPYGRTQLFIKEIARDIYRSNSDWKIILLRYFNRVSAHPNGLIGEDPRGIPNNLMSFVRQVAVGKRPAMLRSSLSMHHHRRQYSDHLTDAPSKWLQSTNLSQDFMLHVREVSMHVEASEENHLNGM
ncbi:hypothetical protein ACFX2I_031579 [Malus domestica]